MLDINTVIRKISDLGYMRVLVEGGSKLSASLLNENLIDEIAWGLGRAKLWEIKVLMLFQI